LITITFQRDKCIGCNYCHEHAPMRWTMSKKDGKAVMLNSVNKNGFHIAKVHESEEEEIQRAVEACPVKIIRIGG